MQYTTGFLSSFNTSTLTKKKEAEKNWENMTAKSRCRAWPDRRRPNNTKQGKVIMRDEHICGLIRSPPFHPCIYRNRPLLRRRDDKLSIAIKSVDRPTDCLTCLLLAVIRWIRATGSLISHFTIKDWQFYLLIYDWRPSILWQTAHAVLVKQNKKKYILNNLVQV